MLQEAEFFIFLTKIKKSCKSGQFFSSRVSQDVLRRCRLVEKYFNIQLNEVVMSDKSSFDRLIGEIKQFKVGAAASNQYGYNDCIHAIRIFREFLLANMSEID